MATTKKGQLREKRIDCKWVLLAEDDDALRELLRVALLGEGYHVTTARDGQELVATIGTALCKQNAPRMPDVIVSDVRMPKHDGFQVLESIRSADWSVPVVMITAFATQETEVRANALHAVLISKPFDIGQLLQIVMQLTSSDQSELGAE